MPLSLFGLLEQRAQVSPHAEGFVDERYRLTFSGMIQKVDQLSQLLHRQGIKQGDHVAICCKNSVGMAALVFALARVGAVGVLINWRLSPHEIGYVLEDSDAKWAIFDSEFQSTFDFVRVPPHGVRTLERLLDEADFGPAFVQESLPVINADNESAALIMYTSGTTGKPKGAVLSHRNLYWTAQSNLLTAGWVPDDRFLMIAPMFHIGGFAAFVTNVLVGCVSIFMPDFAPDTVWQTVSRERVTSMMSVPAMLMVLLKHALSNDVDFSTIRGITCGASAVPAQLIERYRSLGIAVRQVYGATETGGAVTFWAPGLEIGTPGSQGRPVFYSEMRIVDPQTKADAPTGAPGEVWCRSPMVFKGYWRNEEATREVLHDGWYRTGDIGEVREDGALYIVDRLKDMIISGGENIYPAEIEAVIAQMPGVAEVAVVGRTDPQWGETPIAYVAVTPGVTLSKEQIVGHCKERLGAFKCVRDVVFVQALPRNGVGKVLKRSLQNLATSAA